MLIELSDHTPEHLDFLFLCLEGLVILANLADEAILLRCDNFTIRLGFSSLKSQIFTVKLFIDLLQSRNLGLEVCLNFLQFLLPSTVDRLHFRFFAFKFTFQCRNLCSQRRRHRVVLLYFLRRLEPSGQELV